MALALYRRYRPDTFEGVIGQDQVTVPLMRALDEGKLTHAYLFSGPRGCGKTSSARILARCVNCVKGPTSHPCGECESCKDLATGGPGSIDVVEIDAASHNGVDDARELRERAGFAPARDRYKIFILDEAHMVTPQGFNALLKIVEEPPEHVMFIFATTEPDKVIGTIRSRTHHYPFRLVPAEIMGPYLEEICEKEHIKPEPGVLKLAMRAGGGSVRDTLSVLDQLMVGSVDGVITHDASVALLGFTPEALIGEAVDAVIDRSGEKLYGVIQKVVVGGFDPRRFVEDLLARVRDLLVLTLAGDKAESVLSDTAEAEEMGDLHRQAAALGLGALTAMADIINDTLGAMTGAISPRMRLELLAARLLAGAENGFAAPAVAVTGASGVGAASAAGAASGATPGGAGAGAASGAVSGHGGFAGAARNAGVAGGAAAGHGGFAGAARNTGASSSNGGFAGASHNQSGVGQSGGDAVAPSAAQSQPAQSGQPAQAPQEPDNRTPDQKWDALVAALPADVRRYVTRDKVLRISYRPYKQTGRMRLWLKFDKPLSKYAFALAVAAEEVDGSNKVVNILRAEVRKVFGEQTEIAPTPTTDDGQKTPAFSKLPAGEQQRIKAQLVQENLKAAVNLAPTAETGNAAAAQEGGREPQAQAAHTAGTASDDDEAHRGGATASHVSSSETASSLDDDDPWAHPLPARRAASGSGAARSSVSGDSAAPEEHHHKHVAVPDLSDGIDPWAQPVPAKRPSAAGVDPWNQSASAAGGIRSGSGAGQHGHAPGFGTAQQGGGRPANGSAGGSTNESDDPWKDVPPPVEPDDPWGAPSEAASGGGFPQGGAHGVSRGTFPSPAASGGGMAGGSNVSGFGTASASAAADPWNMGRTVQPSGPAGAQPQVAADEDEYSMDDRSLGEATAMDRDELRKLFEVKKVEEFAADDPRNPRNMHPAPRHDGE
ncbi:DNA polymerase III, subunit gamma and tau [Bifidobacterium rousetti]|uniref:DNA polymerase III subunit gamma/tau n=1 Tax=Bifidobacterium rousetti TaxID=2045439 RepID=UPI00123BF464|nr:DNA polymerase III subunit gamma/tau [Bifidobacterium rousetti]KAA8819122.1 DNA polymerase III, subunit gamma and tau [Bifidobacterium rousetti]